MPSDFPISFDWDSSGWCYENTQFSFADVCLTWEQSMIGAFEPLIFFWFGFLYFRWRKRKNINKKIPPPN